MYCLSEFFRSKDDREYFWQWDTNQTLIVLRPELTEVHYASPDGTALVTKTYEKDGQLLSDVPNILLQQSGWLTVWFCDDDKTIRSQKITIAARQKPASYVYTETEVLTWESLDERITALEESGGGEGPGTPGKDGKSAYEIALEHGFEGSEEEWLESLQGKDGEPGQPGKDGIDGKDGADGLPGEKGEKGDKGDTGEPGQPGAKGDKGDPGEKGEKGEKGDPGQPGADGLPGAKGDKGDKGDPGEPGQDGKDGADGQPGRDGTDGSDGISPIVSVQDIDGGHRVVITDAEGEKTFDVMDGTGGGGASVQSDLTVNDETDPAYVKGRTHYDIPPEIDIQWDGDMTGRFALDMSMLGYDPGVYLVKVSDLVLTPEELVGCTFTAFAGGLIAQTITEDMISVGSPLPGVYNVNSWIVVAYNADIINSALGAPSGYVTNGVYFIKNPNAYTRTLTKGTASVKKLDKKYLPDFVATVNGKTPDANGNVEIATGGGGSGGTSVQADWGQNDPEQADYVKNRTHWVERPFEPIVWDGNTEGRDFVDVSLIMGYLPGEAIAYKVSDHVLTKEEIAIAKVEATAIWSDGQVHNVEAEFLDVTDMVPSAIWVVNYTDRDELDGTVICTAVSGDFTSMFGVMIPSTGTYVVQRFQHSININADVYYPMDSRFLPDIAYDDLRGKPEIPKDVVRYETEQSLDDVQKATARTNIGAVGASDVYKKSEVDELVSDVETLAEYIRGDLSVLGQNVGFRTTAKNSTYIDENGVTYISDGTGAGRNGFQYRAFGRESLSLNSTSYALGTDSIAGGIYSRSIGSRSVVFGFYNHAMGNDQFVIGRNNIPDTTSVLIVGNAAGAGLGYSQSNAHTLDWDGNAWYAGYVEGTALILPSPNGTRWRITVDDSGNLVTAVET